MAARIDDSELLERERRSQAAYYRLLVGGDPGSFVADLDGGVQATVVPVSPERSLPNSVVYEDPAAVIAAHDDLVALYASAGVRAWTVWVRPGDDDLFDELERRGHKLDGTPAIMGAELAALDLEPRASLDLDPDGSWGVAGLINDQAYGLPRGSLTAFLEGLDVASIEPLIARVDGKPAACASFHVSDDDCAVEFVATLPEARGRGIAAELMRQGLRRARDAGATTTTLEGSALGEPIYERLGYRVVGRMRMMERRTGTS